MTDLAPGEVYLKLKAARAGAVLQCAVEDVTDPTEIEDRSEAAAEAVKQELGLS